MTQKVHFRLTSMAQKSCCLNISAKLLGLLSTLIRWAFSSKTHWFENALKSGSNSKTHRRRLCGRFTVISLARVSGLPKGLGRGDSRWGRGEREKRKEVRRFSPSALSLFRFHLSSFLPETPDTQAIIWPPGSLAAAARWLDTVWTRRVRTVENASK